MKLDNELNKCHKIVDSALKGYLEILEKKSLLEQSITSARDMTNNLTPCTLSSVKVIQETLYSSILIDVHAWLFDPSEKSSNLSIRKLLKKMEDPKREDFREFLKKYYIRPPSTISLSMDTSSSWQNRYKEEKEQEFNKLLSQCLESYQSFLNSEFGKRIIGIRSKLLAHKEGVYSTQDNGHYIGEAIEAVEKMRTITLSFNKLMQKFSYTYVVEEVEQSAKKKAESFWNNLAQT